MSPRLSGSGMTLPAFGMHHARAAQGRRWPGRRSSGRSGQRRRRCSRRGSLRTSESCSALPGGLAPLVREPPAPRPAIQYGFRVGRRSARRLGIDAVQRMRRSSTSAALTVVTLESANSGSTWSLVGARQRGRRRSVRIQKDHSGPGPHFRSSISRSSSRLSRPSRSHSDRDDSCTCLSGSGSVVGKGLMMR